MAKAIAAVATTVHIGLFISLSWKWAGEARQLKLHPCCESPARTVVRWLDQVATRAA